MTTEIRPDRKLFFNSSLAFALAGMVATTLHELAHLVAGKLLGLQAMLYSNAVEFSGFGSGTTAHQITTAATGPLFSLVSGLVLIAIAGHWGKGFIRLFWMWLGLISAQIGFGYFLIAPFAQGGDTGQVLKLLTAPGIVYGLSFIIGVLGTLWLSRQFAKQVVRYTDKTVATMRPFGIYSWLTGTAIMLVVYIFAVRNLSDADQAICLTGVVASGIFAPMFSFFWRKQDAAPESLQLHKPIIGYVLVVAVAAVLIFGLANGIQF